MYRDELEKMNECCFKCKYYNIGSSSRVGVINGKEFYNKEDLLRQFPDHKKEDVIVREKFYDSSISSGSECRKSPPRMPGKFPKINPNEWCGSFKFVEAK